ncbi:reverse transcriptase domain-containing protein [Tanacetum coccineum]|uniref:Reverse transcriptase domain-containing protein n=1 Tax=Tanacetum coccineum TaxID=301880 RepID=A0ABQ4Z250_9ASTR
MDDELMWAANRVVVLTLGSAITIPETANEFTIKGEAKTWLDELNEGTIKTKMTQEVLNAAAGGIFLYKTPNQAYQLLEDKVLLKLDSARNQITKSSLKKTVAFADEDTFMDLKTKLKTTTKNHQALIQNLKAKFDILADKQSARPSGYLPSNTQPNPKGSSSKPYQPPQARNEHVNGIFFWSGKSYDPPINLNDQQNKSETPINFDSEDEDEESTPQPKSQTPKPVKETPIPKPYKLKIGSPIWNVELWKISKRTLPPKLGDPGSFLIPCNFSKAFSCNALADLGAHINLMLYSLYAKLSLETLKPTKISVRLADRSFQHPIGIAKNMIVEVGKFTFLIDFVILEMEKDSKVPLILGRPFLHTIDASYSNDDTCFSIDVIDEILEEDFDALLDEGRKILYSIEGTILEEKLFAGFDEFMAMTADENFEPDSETEEPPFKKITFNTNYKIKTSLEEQPSGLK